MKSELEEPLVAFAGGMKERRKIVQTGIEKLHKVKVQQTQAVNKVGSQSRPPFARPPARVRSDSDDWKQTRKQFEQDCLKIKGYLAQGHMVMGHEERKNKAKLEKTQAQLTTNSHEYENAVKTLEETSAKWVKEWKVACDKFQDLEEERLDFTKSCLWNYANIASTACVSDDASCEKIRVSLEDCEVEKDIACFIRERGTGQEIPDPPKFINFCADDDDDDDDDEEEEDDSAFAGDNASEPGFQVARFHRPQPKMIRDDEDDAPPIGPSSEIAALPPPPPASPSKKGSPSESALSRGGDARRTPTAGPGGGGGDHHQSAPLDVRRPRHASTDPNLMAG
ncbi:hypothetical protein KEM52_003373, partial [Ascosphaera acerosa]